MQSVIKKPNQKKLLPSNVSRLRRLLKQETKKEYFKSGLKKRLFSWEISLV